MSKRIIVALSTCWALVVSSPCPPSAHAAPPAPLTTAPVAHVAPAVESRSLPRSILHAGSLRLPSLGPLAVKFSIDCCPALWQRPPAAIPARVTLALPTPVQFPGRVALVFRHAWTPSGSLPALTPDPKLALALSVPLGPRPGPFQAVTALTCPAFALQWPNGNDCRLSVGLRLVSAY